MRERSITSLVALGSVALSLVGFGVAAQTLPTQPKPGASLEAPPAVPAGQVNRYSIPNFYSLTGGTTRSFTSIHIKNNAVVTCNAAVRLQQGQSTTDACVITLAVPARQSRRFCSRPLNSADVEFCEIACPGAGLTGNAGHAFVTSDNNANCANIAVDARLFYTTDPNDAAIGAVSRLTVVKVNEPNRGD